jgi:CHAT domain-containing protein
MGNRGNRFDKRIGRDGPRAVGRRLWVFLLPFVLSGNSYATGCDSLLNAGTTLFQATVQVRGKVPVQQPLPAVNTSQLMVFAREHGVDVTLAVSDSTGQVLASADSPIRRAAVQRLVIPAKSGQRYLITVTGKDHADSRGSVDLVALDLHQAANSACLAAQKSLAQADAAYAAGESVTRALVTNSELNSDKSYQEAADGYSRVAATLQTLGPSSLLAQAQLATASLYNLNLANFPASKDWAARAAQTYGALQDNYGKARATATGAAAASAVALNARRSGNGDADRQGSAMLAEARAQLEGVAAFHAAREEFYEQAWAQNFIGVMFYYEGRYDEAIQAYQKALTPYARMHDRTGQAQVLQNLALVEYELGRLSDSTPHFRRALELVTPEENPKLIAEVLSNSALSKGDRGNGDAALRELSQSLALARKIQNIELQAVALHHIASVYADLGDETRSLDFYRQALNVFASIHHARGETASLRAMANMLRQKGDPVEALKLDQRALAVAATSSARLAVQVQIAKDLIALGKLKDAADTLESVLNRNSGASDIARARALAERSGLRASEHNVAAAESDLRAALATFKSNELRMDEFFARVALAELIYRRGATSEALAAVDQALALAEEVRLQSANPELRSTSLQPLRAACDLKIAILFGQIRSPHSTAQVQDIAMRALETAEQARARALADYQTLDISAPGLDPALIKRRQVLYRELATRRASLETLLDRTGTRDAESQLIRSDIASLRDELDQIDARIGSASLGQRALGSKRTVVPLAHIPADVALIEYWLGEKQSFAWVATREGVNMYPIGPSQRLNTAANALHTALRSFGSVPKSERLGAGERLYGLVLEPLAGKLAGRRTLIFAPDGALHYVPFAALRATENGRKVFLVENHDVAVTPSLQMFLQRGSNRPTIDRAGVPDHAGKMLLVDDPVYDTADPRVARSSPAPANSPQARNPLVAVVRGPTDPSSQLPRLPGAAREAAAIASLMPSANIDRLDGFAANRERFLSAALDRYRLIHIASHATMDSEVPQASALILSTVDTSGQQIYGRVLAADFLGVRFHADAVVLSACDTALGKSVAGEGLIGLQYVVLARGARSVVSSLWPAMDQMTAGLMVEFYSTLLRPHATVIAAWSAASRAALTGPYSDPGTWGAFILTLSHVEDLNAT